MNKESSAVGSKSRKVIFRVWAVLSLFWVTLWTIIWGISFFEGGISFFEGTELGFHLMLVLVFPPALLGIILAGSFWAFYWIADAFRN